MSPFGATRIRLGRLRRRVGATITPSRPADFAA